MNRLIVYTVLFPLLGFLTPAPAADRDEPESAKAALQAFNDFIGTWKGSGAPGTPERPRTGAREVWSETVDWSWRFKGDDAWLVMKIKNGKYLQGGELRYLTDKNRYQLTAIDKKGKKVVFEGELKKGYLTLDRVDPATKETQRLAMNLAGDGARFIYRYSHKPGGVTLFVADYHVAATKEGESLGAKEKKVECVVSGGLGKIAVSYNGQTYYVCCSGCRDAFLENPEKYLKEFEARKREKP
jgi:hypothetical protein